MSDSKKTKKEKTSKPTRPISAYLRFANHCRENLKVGGTVGDQAKAISAKWTVLSEAEKKPFITEYEKAKKVYDAENEAYKKTDEYKKEMEIKESQNYQPKNTNGYNMFVRMKFDDLKKDGNKTNMKNNGAAIRKEWQSLSEEDKNKYKKLADEKNKKVAAASKNS